MKPYGIPRNFDTEYPDLADMQHYGLKASKGNLQGKGGDIRRTQKSAKAKAASRRIYKRKARRAAETCEHCLLPISECICSDVDNMGDK